MIGERCVVSYAVTVITVYLAVTVWSYFEVLETDGMQTQPSVLPA